VVKKRLSKVLINFGVCLVISLKRRLWPYNCSLLLKRKGSTRSAQLIPKGSRELKRLDCFINYASKGSTSKFASRRGWVSSVHLGS
jgi:hypothetical protein